MAGAEGATAPETLRQKDQQGAVITLERSAKALAEGITISGEGTEGAQENGAAAPDCEPAPCNLAPRTGGRLLDGSSELKKTPLHALNVSLGGRMVPFAGY